MKQVYKPQPGADQAELVTKLTRITECEILKSLIKSYADHIALDFKKMRECQERLRVLEELLKEGD